MTYIAILIGQGVELLKILLMTIASVTILFQGGLAKSKNFFLGFELGLNQVDYKSEPLAILPYDNSGTAALLTPCARLGYRIKGNHFLARFDAGGSQTIEPSSGHNFNAAQIYLASLVLSTSFLDIKRFGVSGIGGYQYAYFNAFPTDDHSRNYRYVDSGTTFGIETRFNFKKNEKNEKAFVGFSYEHVDIEHPLRCLTFQVGVSGDVIGSGFIKFRYYNQKDTYNLFVLTAGGYWYLWF